MEVRSFQYESPDSRLNFSYLSVVAKTLEVGEAAAALGGIDQAALSALFRGERTGSDLVLERGMVLL